MSEAYYSFYCLLSIINESYYFFLTFFGHCCWFVCFSLLQNVMCNSFMDPLSDFYFLDHFNYVFNYLYNFVINSDCNSCGIYLPFYFD